MVKIANTAWYSLRVTPQGGGDAVPYYLKSDARRALTAAWEDIKIAGHEGARYDAVNTGYREEITVTVYDGGDNFAVLRDAVINPSVGATAMDGSKAISCKLQREGGNGIAEIIFLAIPVSIGETFSNRDGIAADVTFNVFTVAPALS